MEAHMHVVGNQIHPILHVRLSSIVQFNSNPKIYREAIKTVLKSTTVQTVRFYGFYPNKVVGGATFPHSCHRMAYKGCEFSYFHALRTESPVLHQQCQLRCSSGCVLLSAVPGVGQGQLSHSPDLRASSSNCQK